MLFLKIVSLKKRLLDIYTKKLRLTAKAKILDSPQKIG